MRALAIFWWTRLPCASAFLPPQRWSACDAPIADDDPTPKQGGPGLPRQLGTGDRSRALRIESQLNLTGLRTPQYEMDHIVTPSEQQNGRGGQCKATEKHHPIP